MDFQLTDANREHFVEWLKDRAQFSIWFVSVITASFMGLTFFGKKPGVEDPQALYLLVALALLLLSLVLNFVNAWTIPTWRLRIATGTLARATRMYYELATITWIAVILFVVGLTLGFAGNMEM
jgi:hypothetical protein